MVKDKKFIVKPVPTKTPTDGLKVNVIKINENNKKVKATDVFGKAYSSKSKKD